MAGHSKWANIKHKKAKTDAKRGKVFTKVVREIMMAARLGGDDVSSNPRLRLALQKAKEVNMPNDNVKRAIQKGVGAGDEANFEEVTFEAYGPHGVGLLIQTLTDNKNRTVPNIKAALTRSDGSMATPGAVSYMFEKKGLMVFEPGDSEEKIMDLATENGAEDFIGHDDGSIEVITTPESFEEIKGVFDSEGIECATAAITQMPSNIVALDEEAYNKIQGLIDKLEEDDDVQEVFTNCEQT